MAVYWTDILPASIARLQTLSPETVLALKNNPSAIAAGAAGAPRIRSGALYIRSITLSATMSIMAGGAYYGTSSGYRAEFVATLPIGTIPLYAVATAFTFAGFPVDSCFIKKQTNNGVYNTSIVVNLSLRAGGTYSASQSVSAILYYL